MSNGLSLATTRKLNPHYAVEKRYRETLKGCASRRQIVGRYHSSIRGRASMMLNNARSNARRLGIECSLTRDWIVGRLSLGKCEVTGVKFDIRAFTGSQQPWAPSLDRVDNTGPYSPENTRVVCWLYNRAKGAYTDQDVLRLARAILYPGTV